jgi:hypothetical protein
MMRNEVVSKGVPSPSNIEIESSSERKRAYDSEIVIERGGGG